MAYGSNCEQRAIADLIHAAVRSQSPDDRLMTLRMVEAEIIFANYREHAHELLADMAKHDVFDFLLAMALAEQDLHDDQRRVA